MDLNKNDSGINGMSNALILNLVILLGVLHFLSGVIFILHRLSLRFGLLPLVFFLGGLVATLQFRYLGMLTLDLAGKTLQISAGSYTLLPVLLLGLLVIYVIDGTTHARNTLYGLIILTVFVAASQIFPTFYQSLPAAFHLQINPGLPAPRIPLASAATLIVDMIVITVAYQIGSNLHRRSPSRLAGVLALLLALWSDAIIFPIFAHLGSPDWLDQLPVNLLGKSISGLALAPVIVIYLTHAQKAFSTNAASSPRPVLDLFSTHLQLEARAQYQYGLLRTISQINQLILRNNQPAALVEQSCQLLCQGRDYGLVWISLFDGDMEHRDGKEHREGNTYLQANIKAGPLVGKSGSLNNEQYLAAAQTVLSESILASKQAGVFKESPLANPSWQSDLHKAGISACAAFPMRHESRTAGVLCVYATRIDTFDNPDEISLLQELADDLAYALISLEARQQQAFLSTAAETMRDGLIITDLRGCIIYANPAFMEMLGFQTHDVIRRRIFELAPSEEVEKFRKEHLQSLAKNGQFTTEMNMTTFKGQALFSIKAALVRNSRGKTTNVVVSVRDITTQRMYEQRLLTINRIVTELVQIHDLRTIYQTILLSSEELLGSAASVIILIESNHGTITNVHPHNFPEACVAHIQGQFYKPNEALKATFSDQLFIEQISKHEKFATDLNFLPQNGLQSMMSLPIVYEEVSWGSMCFFYKEPHSFEGAEKQLGLAVSNSLAIAIQNAQLYQAERRQRQLSEALAGATAVLNSSLELDTVLDRILEQTMQVLPCRSTALMLIEGSQARIVRQMIRSSSGKIESVSGGQAIPLNTPTLVKMLETGEPVLIPDTVLDRQWRDFGLTTWIRSYASAPLSIRQETIGFLNINSDKPGFFTPDLLPSLKGFASNASAALHNARLYRELQARTLDLEDRIHERTSELSSAKELMEAILASVPDAVFVLDENDLLLEANRAGAILLLETEKSGVDLFADKLMERLKSGEAVFDEMTLLEVKGRAYQALASPMPIKETRTGMVVVYRDVTRFHELDQMKTQFVSDVSHELRTPLTSLSLYLDLLSKEDNEERRQRFQATLRRETNRLTQLIEDLLTISRLESNRVPINIQPVDINQLVNDLALDRTPIAAQRNISLQCVSRLEPTLALADPRLITQVLSNLLTNAINYTQANGKIQIEITQLKDQSGNWIKIAIEDSGVGIPPDELPHIFERFYRGSASRQTGSPGTGLGLAISTEILDRMNGHITVESEVGKGSTFTIWLNAVL